MNPHELQKIEIRGRWSSMTFIWWCSCGHRQTEVKLGLDRTTGLGDWDSATMWAFTDHENHVRDSMKRAAAAPHIIEAARPAIEAAFREKWAGPNRDKCQWWCEQYVQCQCGAADELEGNN